jgi:hypothetical protein
MPAAFLARFDARRLQRWTSAVCLVLVLTVAAFEVVHIHSGAGVVRESNNPCLVCISAQTNVPVVVLSFVAVLLAIAIIPLSNEVHGTRTASRLELFSRPPPSL